VKIMPPKDKIDFPRHWPILFVLSQLKRLDSHFLLQKFIFLAKVEGRIPFINYIFIKETHGPYCVDIKSDAAELSHAGAISMDWDADDSRWVFASGENTGTAASKALEGIPEKWLRKFAEILKKYEGYSVSGLEAHVYKHHVRSHEKNTQILSSIRSSIESLGKSTEVYPPNYNSFLIQAIVAYCLLVLKKNRLDDIIQEDFLIRNMHYLLSCVTEIVELVDKSPDCLVKMDLRDLEEEFEQTQLVCKELGGLPVLEEMDLSLLKS